MDEDSLALRERVIESGDPIALFEAANELAANDDHVAALELYDAAIARDAAPEMHFNRGNSLHALGRTRDAAEAYRAVLVLDPEDRGAACNLADALLALGQAEEALDIARVQLARHPFHPQSGINVVKALAALGRFDEALFEWAQLLSIYTVDILLAAVEERMGGPDPLRTARAIVAVLAARLNYDAEARAKLREEALARLEPLLTAGAGPDVSLLVAEVLIDHPERRAETLPHVQRALDAGLAEAHTVLGYLLYRGLGVEKDDLASRAQHLLAAEKGVADSQFELSIYFDNGIGGAPSRERAREWEAKAAEQNHARACLNVASWAAAGTFGPIDMDRAVAYYERAAVAGSFPAAYRLAGMFEQGLGVEQDPARALRWLRVVATMTGTPLEDA